MPLKIVRNDITKMNTQAIVNTANDKPTVGTGCDSAIYKAAGYDELLAYRKEKIGEVPEGDAFITPGFNLKAEYIIHAVSPLYLDGEQGEEEKLRSCYRKSLSLALENGITSISFPLISTGGFGYPKEEGLRIAIDEINAFLMKHDMLIYLVVFDDKMTALGGKVYPGLEEYIDRKYVDEKKDEEYGDFRASGAAAMSYAQNLTSPRQGRKLFASFGMPHAKGSARAGSVKGDSAKSDSARPEPMQEVSDNMESAQKEPATVELSQADMDYDFYDKHESKLDERIRHLSDTFSQYLLYLIQSKNMVNADVYKRAIVDKKTFSKIKNDINYHPQKLTALCLCVGARLNLDESKDLLARAGYALSPCDKTDIIFSYFIENEIYDMIELDIQLEEHGLPCIIS